MRVASGASRLYTAPTPPRRAGPGTPHGRLCHSTTGCQTSARRHRGGFTLATTIVWFRRDLRLADNPALSAAAERGAILPVFVWDPRAESPWEPGGAERWWLHQSLASLDAALRRRHSRLVLRRGSALEILQRLARDAQADAVYWNRRYEPFLIERDAQVKSTLRRAGLQARSFNAALLLEPREVANQSGDPYRVFTPFWKACRGQLDDVVPQGPPGRVSSPADWPRSDALADLELEPSIDWAAGLRETWTPGEQAAQQAVEEFASDAVHDYEDQRDLPGVQGTSRLSPHLHHGEISPRQVWHSVQRRIDASRRPGRHKAAEAYLRQLGWREFAYHLLVHFPHTPTQPLRPEFARFPWEQDDTSLRLWQKGRTGYPIVDAGMRELWQTGWMHNRVRMIVASFLVKDLLIPWTEGARWFWDTLVDADLANNTLGWQWSAGCGADAAPYFRIFNPVLQGRRFDPQGDYIRRWLPELAQLPDKSLHAPWEASSSVRRDAGVALGSTYPEPIVDHSRARQAALDALATISGNRR